VETLFATFLEEPLAAASLAQVPDSHWTLLILNYY